MKEIKSIAQTQEKKIKRNQTVPKKSQMLYLLFRGFKLAILNIQSVDGNHA